MKGLLELTEQERKLLELLRSAKDPEAFAALAIRLATNFAGANNGEKENKE